jgi:4-amino-4-deoxy-L-arabinose transferase-like glycosyltransferase
VKLTKRYPLILILLSFGVFFFFVTQGIDLPYVGPYAFNFNIYSLIAHNYNYFGFLETNFAPIINASESIPVNPEYYLHHPPLISIIEAIFFRIFGEEFWVGRLTVIIFSTLSVFLLYLNAKLIKNSRFAVLVFLIAALIPATSIFGRMIGQEPLVLFFSQLALYSSIKFIKKSNKKYFYLSIVSVILGTLSDWPMVYFIFSLLPYFFYIKKLKFGIFLFGTSVLTALGFMIYLATLQNGFGEIISAFFVRSSTWQITPYYLWPILWILTIITRFVIYFNPIFALLTLIGILGLVKSIYKKKYNSNLFLFLGLFLFGFVHVVLYPSGSFGHIYWIFYFIPFVSFISAQILEKYFNDKFIILGIIFLSILFLYGVNRWKIGEIKANVWRYDLAVQASNNLPKFERVMINRDGSMDTDVFRYKFLHEYILEDSNNFKNSKERFYIYSCDTTCNLEEKNLKNLTDNYGYVRLNSSQGEGYLFDKKKPKIITESSAMPVNDSSKSANTSTSANEQSLFRVFYVRFVNFLQVPFL